MNRPVQTTKETMYELIASTDPRLTTPSTPVEGQEGLVIARGLREVLLSPKYASTGAGLAAPQVGVNKQVIVLSDGRILLNPKITKHHGTKIPPRLFKKPVLEGGEGCLSFPGLRVVVPRWENVEVEYEGATDEEVLKVGLFEVEKVILVTRIARFRGFQAVLLQHEIEHLEGRTLETNNQDATNRPLAPSDNFLPIG